MSGSVGVPVDELAQEIRRVDGNHSLGAGALAEALLPFLSERLAAAPAPSSLAGGEVESRALDWMEWVAQGALDTDDAQLSGAEIIQHAEIELASIRKQAALSPKAPARQGVDATPVEIAFGCLRRTITDDDHINVARNEIRQSMTRLQMSRGVEWAVRNLPHVTDGEIARIDL